MINLFKIKKLFSTSLIVLISIYLPYFLGSVQKVEALTFTQKNNQDNGLFLKGVFSGEDNNNDGLLTLPEISDFESTVFDVSSLSDTGNITLTLAQLRNFEYKIGTTKNLFFDAGLLMLTSNSGLILSEEFYLFISNREELGSVLSNTFTIINQDEIIVGVADNFEFQPVIIQVPESCNGLAIIVFGMVLIVWRKIR